MPLRRLFSVRPKKNIEKEGLPTYISPNAYVMFVLTLESSPLPRAVIREALSDHSLGSLFGILPSLQGFAKVVLGDGECLARRTPIGHWSSLVCRLKLFSLKT